MNNLLQRIANTLVLYSYHINDNGLFTGRTGIIYYLYNYSYYVGNEYYSDFAGDLLDKVLKASNGLSNDFEHGLTGIGWIVSRLLRENLVDGEPNKVLQNVDKKVFSRIACDPEISLLGHAIYLLERLKFDPDGLNLLEQIDNILKICENGLQKYVGKISLYHINSVLYFLIAIDKERKYFDRVENIRKLLPNVLKRIIDQRLYDATDQLIFNQLIENVGTVYLPRWNYIRLYQFLKMIDYTDPVERYIYTARMQEIYFGIASINAPSDQQINDFIDRKQESITLDGFLYQKGLAGLGCAILKSNLK